jgi:hypothetical protein
MLFHPKIVVSLPKTISHALCDLSNNSALRNIKILGSSQELNQIELSVCWKRSVGCQHHYTTPTPSSSFSPSLLSSCSLFLQSLCSECQPISNSLVLSLFLFLLCKHYHICVISDGASTQTCSTKVSAAREMMLSTIPPKQ